MALFKETLLHNFLGAKVNHIKVFELSKTGNYDKKIIYLTSNYWTRMCLEKYRKEINLKYLEGRDNVLFKILALVLGTK